MTGWRLGWVATTDSLAADIAKVHQQMVSSVPSFLQASACEALRTSTSDSRESTEGAETLPDALTKMALPAVRPEGALRVPRISNSAFQVRNSVCGPLKRQELLGTRRIFGAEGFWYASVMRFLRHFKKDLLGAGIGSYPRLWRKVLKKHTFINKR